MGPKKSATVSSLAGTKATATTTEKSQGDYEDDFESEVEDVDNDEEEEEEEAEEAAGEEEEEEEEADDDEEEEAEEEESSDDDDDEDDEDLVDPLVVKINRQGDTKWTLCKLPNDIKLNAFLKAIATQAGYSDYRDALVYYLPATAGKDNNTAQRIPIANAKQLKAASDHFWNGTSKHLRVVVVNGMVDRDSLKHAMFSPLVAATAPPPASLLSPPGVQIAPPTPMSRMGSSDASLLSGTFRSESDSIRQQIDEQGANFHWTKMRSLGSGAYGQVFEALTDSGRLIAVKHLVIPSDAPACVASSSQAADELLSEIRLLKKLRHRHIVEYYGCQTAVEPNGTRIFDIFLEHCHGGSINALRHRFDKQQGRLSVVLVRNYVRQVLRGLEYLHRKGVVHRDIKGDNVLIGGNGEAKLADFGCSKQVSTSLAKTTDLSGDGSPAIPGVPCKTLVGTPLFMAPEVLKETSDGYSSSADVWSLGCLVLELFGHKPWDVQGATLFSIMYAVATQTTPPSGMPQEMDDKLRTFLMACFQRDPAKRPSTSTLLGYDWMVCPDNELVEPVWTKDPPRPESRQAAAVASGQ